jgi:hypothetical protein
VIIFGDFDVSEFWEDSEWYRNEYSEPSPSSDMVASVERELGYKLPATYVELARVRNGGAPRNTCHRTDSRTSWSNDHVAITNIKAIGRANIWSLCGELGRDNTIHEWDYPAIGVYFADCPSAGHDKLCLDYRACGAAGEPTVVHVDQEFDYRITFVAPCFEAFIRGLLPSETFDYPDQ